MKREINFDKVESQLIAAMMTKHMGFTKEQLMADTKIFNRVLQSDYDRFTICYYLDEIKQDKIDKYNLTKSIQSVKEKLGYTKTRRAI